MKFCYPMLLIVLGGAIQVVQTFVVNSQRQQQKNTFTTDLGVSTLADLVDSSINKYPATQRQDDDETLAYFLSPPPPRRQRVSYVDEQENHNMYFANFVTKADEYVTSTSVLAKAAVSESVERMRSKLAPYLNDSQMEQLNEPVEQQYTNIASTSGNNMQAFVDRMLERLEPHTTATQQHVPQTDSYEPKSKFEPLKDLPFFCSLPDSKVHHTKVETINERRSQSDCVQVSNEHAAPFNLVDTNADTSTDHSTTIRPKRAVTVRISRTNEIATERQEASTALARPLSLPEQFASHVTTIQKQVSSFMSTFI